VTEQPAGAGRLAPAPLRRPRWGHHTGLFQLGQPAFWLFALILLVTGYLAVAEQRLFAEFAPGGLALSWVLLLIYAVPVFLVIYLLDLYEREPPSLLLGAVLWGGIAATQLSGYANTFWGFWIANVFPADFADRWTAALTAPIVEETFKYLGVVLIYLVARDEVDTMLDGFVFGALVGLGFTVVEDVFYFMAVFGGETSGVLTGFYLRVVASGLYGHVLYTGLAGAGLGYFVSHRGAAPLGRRFGVAAGLLALAMVGHFVWNSPLLDFFPAYPWEGGEWLQILVATAVKGVPLLVFVVVVVRLAHRREGALLRGALGSEVGPGAISEVELDVLGDPRRRRAARREAARRGGARAAALTKRLQTGQINLAMIRSRVEADDHPDLVRQRQYCISLKQALGAMPVGAPASVPTPMPAWTATHAVPPGGMQAWAVPDGSTPVVADLPERLPLAIEERREGWARVRASNGWEGWVDAGRLIGS
jgi:protease PrsW